MDEFDADSEYARLLIAPTQRARALNTLVVLQSVGAALMDVYYQFNASNEAGDARPI